MAASSVDVEATSGATSRPSQSPTSHATPHSISHTQQDDDDALKTPHPNTPEQQEDDEPRLFSCRCESARAVSTLLSCLTIHNTKTSSSMQPVTVFVSPTALTFHVYGTTARQSQASVDMHKGMFSEFHAPTEGEFCVNLTSVLECIHILGTNHISLERTKLCWAFSPRNQVFEMELLEEGGVLSTAAIPGLVVPTPPSESLALAFSQSPVVSRVLLKSEWLRQAWSELEYVPGSTTCAVAVSAQKLELATVGHAGECVVSLAAPQNQNNSCLLSLETKPNSPPHSYPLSSFRLGMRGLEIAEETCLTINEAGMMAIQHQILDMVGDGQANFVDFLMACLEDEEEDEEEQDDVAQTDEPPMSLGWKNSRASQQDDEEEEDDSDDEPTPARPVSAAPLFGTVVVDTAATTKTTTRSKRRKRLSAEATTRREADSDEEHTFEDDDEPFDVTATPRRRRGTREQVSSSPELVYGEDE